MMSVRTLGGLAVEKDGTRCGGAGSRRKTLALLALLAAAGKKGLSRDTLLGYLWPETDADRGRHLLKQACYALRRDLDEPDLFLGRAELRLNPAVVASDVQAFEDASRQGDLARAAALYVGPFLDGFYLDGAGEFEHWAQAQRTRLANRASAALETLATAAAARGDHRVAAERWRQFAALDPLSSRAALGLMTALAALGEVAGALEHGRAYEDLVRQEFGTAPDPTLTAALLRLRREPRAAEGVTAEDLRLAALTGGRRRTVGYEKERAALWAGLESALTGRGLVVCIAGEPGSGKTTLVEDFLGEVVTSGRPSHIVRGRCSERLAGSGAYLPLLDALEGLLRGDARGLLTRLMKEVAPNWYAQVAPSLQTGGSPGQAPQMLAASQERLKRELNAFFRDVCGLRPLVVFLDDVHWVDAATIDILGYVANQIASAQMLIVATYRPSELQLAKHPFGALKLDLQSRGLCRDVSLELLTRDDIEQFLALEFPRHRFPSPFGAFVHAKTEGSPLFIVDLLRYLRAKNIVAAENGGWKLAAPVPDLERELPESVRSMIERKIEQLSAEDRRLLMAAGVQGYECDSPIVAKVLGIDSAEVEERLETVGRVHGFVRRLREYQLPDATPAVRYRFVHVLYQNALYARLTATRRQSLSLEAAEALVGHYGVRSVEVAAELAILFEAARDHARAVEYFTFAAQRSRGVFAYREATALARRGLALLETLPNTTERAGRELTLQLILGHALDATDSSGNRDTGRCMMRVRDLCQQLGQPPALFPAMLGVWAYYLVRSEQQAAREVAERMLGMAGEAQDPVWLAGAHGCLGASLTHMADHTAGLAHLQRAMELYDPRQRQTYRSLYGQDLGVYWGCEIERTLWILGYPERARRQMEHMLALAHDGAEPLPTAFALTYAVILHQLRREAEQAQEQADLLISLCDEHGISGHREWGMCIRGWALAEQGLVEEGIAVMREHTDALGARRMLVEGPYFLAMLAETLEKAGHVDEGLATIAAALEIAHTTNQPVYMAECLRLKGELLAKGGDNLSEAEALLREALTIASRQGAKSLELRTAMSLACLWQREGKKDDARAVLAPAYSWFSEGFETVDVRAAKAVLEGLS